MLERSERFDIAHDILNDHCEMLKKKGQTKEIWKFLAAVEGKIDLMEIEYALSKARRDLNKKHEAMMKSGDNVTMKSIVTKLKMKYSINDEEVDE